MLIGIVPGVLQLLLQKKLESKSNQITVKISLKTVGNLYSRYYVEIILLKMAKRVLEMLTLLSSIKEPLM